MEDEQLDLLKEYFKDEIRHAIREEMGTTLTDNLKEEFRDLLSHVQSTIREIKDNAALNNSISSSSNYGTKRKLESEEDAVGHSGENKKRKTTDDRVDSFPRREDTKYASSSYESDRKPLIDEDRDRLEKDDRRNTYKEYSTERPLESRDRPLESRDSSTRRRSEGDREGSLTSSSGRYSPRGDTHQPSSRGVGSSGSDDRMWDSVHSRSSSSSTYPKTSSSSTGGSGYSSSSTYRDDYYRSKLPPVKDSHHSSSRLGERRRTPPPLSSSWKDSSSTSGSASTGGSSYRSSSSSTSSGAGATGERIRGTIKSMLHYRGYGHIEHPDFPDGLWFSFSQVQFEPAELKLGDEVEFEIGHNGKAPCANNIRWPSSNRRYY